MAYQPPDGFQWDANDPQGSFLRLTRGTAANSDTLRGMGDYLGQQGWRLGNPNASGVIDSIIGRGKQGQDWVIDVGQNFSSGNGSWQWGDWHGDRGGWQASAPPPAAPPPAPAPTPQTIPGIQPAAGAPPIPTRDPRWDELYNTYLQRSKRGLAIDRNDPAVRGQADAYSANEERARRNYLGDLAERLGPGANLRGEQRMAAERVGQRTGAFEAELMGRELTSRRQEIATALQSMQGMLTQEQENALRRELTQYDNAIRQQQLALQGRQLDMQNSQFYSNLGLQNRQLDMQNDQFLANLGFQTDDRRSYWDAIRSGLLG